MAFNSFMHPRNIYRSPPNFKRLALDFPEFKNFVVEKANGKTYVNFKDPKALRILTQILLKRDFALIVQIPPDSLIPTVPQRLNYILWIEDLLSKFPRKEMITGIDIGTGSCAILSLLCARKNGWNIVATEVETGSLWSANENVNRNNLQEKVKIMKSDENVLLEEVCASTSEDFDFCLCNPPFFSDFEEVQRKRKLPHHPKPQEIMVEGGEVSFVKKIIKESLVLKEKIRIYSSMLGRQRSVREIKSMLENTEGVKYSTSEFCQGNTVRWGIAWTFLPVEDFSQMPEKKRKRKKAKPLLFALPRAVTDAYGSVLDISAAIKSLLCSYQISCEVIFERDTEVKLKLVSNKDTWTHQRRKQRELLRAKRNDIGSEENMTNCSVSCHLQNSDFVHCIKDFKNHGYENIDIKQDGIVPHTDEQTFNEDCQNGAVAVSKNNITQASVDLHVSSASAVLLDCASWEHTNNPVLNCYLLLWKIGDGIFMRTACEENGNRETMHQIFLFLKNRLLSPDFVKKNEIKSV